MAESNGYTKMTKTHFQTLCDVEFRNYLMDPTLNPLLKLMKEIKEQRRLLDEKLEELSSYEHNISVMEGYQDDFERKFLNRPKPTTRTVGVYVNITSAEDRAQQAVGKQVKSDPLTQLSQMVPHKASSKDGIVDFVDLTDDDDKVRPKQLKPRETVGKASTSNVDVKPKSFQSVASHVDVKPKSFQLVVSNVDVKPKSSQLVVSNVNMMPKSSQFVVSNVDVKPKISQLVVSNVDVKPKISHPVARQENFVPVPIMTTVSQKVQVGSPPVQYTSAGPFTASLIGLPKTSTSPGMAHQKQITYVVPPSSSHSFKARATVPGTKPAPLAKLPANSLPSSGTVFLAPNPHGSMLAGRATLESLPSTRFIQKQLAPLPEAPKYPSKSIIPLDPPPKPSLKISKPPNGIVLSWNLTLTLSHDKIKCYQLYGYEDTNGPVDSTIWKKVGVVNALPLPMACTLTQFAEGRTYHFAIRAVDVHSRVGPFSDVASITLPPPAN